MIDRIDLVFLAVLLALLLTLVVVDYPNEVADAKYRRAHDECVKWATVNVPDVLAEAWYQP